MLKQMMSGKIHTARLTGCDVENEGSMEIDLECLEEAGILPYEKILVANLENGNRLETYAIRGPRGSGVACLNGAAAHMGGVGDRLIVMCWCQKDENECSTHQPKVVRLDADNRIVASAL